MLKDDVVKGFLLGICSALGVMLICVLVYLRFFYDGGNTATVSYPYLTSQEKSEEDIRTGYETFLAKQKAVLEVIDKNYYDNVDLDSLYNGALSGMISSLNDRYSCYYNPENMAVVSERNDAEYSGIGCTVSQTVDSMEMIVISVIEDSPAEKGGLMIGDIILGTSEVDFKGMDLDVAVEYVRGKEGTPVILKVKRNEEVLELNLVRGKIEQKTIAYHMIDEEIGYIYVAAFYRPTAEQIKKAISNLEGQGMKKIILDFRGNPGGLYTSAVEVLDIILDKDLLVVYTEDKQGRKDESFTKDEDRFDKPIAVLIDENSASAAELVTQTLRDYQKATVVGTTSYGKGVYQDVVTLGVDGSGIRVTGGKYYSPNGVCVDGVGITPDIVVELEEEQKKVSLLKREHDNQVQAAVDCLKNK